MYSFSGDFQGVPLFGCGKQKYQGAVDMSQCSGLNSAVDVQVIVTDGRDMDVDKVGGASNSIYTAD